MGEKSCGYGSGFALIVVLFILLIIIGASFVTC
ncbi:YjcZ family sporulation protein [Priestia megaterium]